MRNFIIVVVFITSLVFPLIAYADNAIILRTGISLVDSVPDIFWGTWRVKSNLLETNSKGSFKFSTVDLWNISRNDNVITLENPFTKAKASISIKEVSDNKVIFEKSSKYNNKNLYDLVELYVDNNSFTGYNYLRLDTVSDIDGRILETKTAKYSLIGDRLSGHNVILEE